jgi:glucose/arabinose dehydrogenase
MAFLPDGRLIVTERPPTPDTTPPAAAVLRLVTQTGVVSAPLDGFPAVAVGMLDVVISPDFTANHLIYVSFYEQDASAPRVGRDVADTSINPAGIAVALCKLTFTTNGGAKLENGRVIWRQFPKIVSSAGSGQPGGRMAFSPDGKYLFMTAGDRQEYDAVQSDRNPAGPFMTVNDTLGKIIRLLPDGGIPTDNPFVATSGAKPEIWTLGHRNQYGLAFDLSGQLWENEMGPKGGDEFNFVEAGSNYGWPSVSYGSNYGDEDDLNPIPGDGFHVASFWWSVNPAPSGMIFYSGTLFPHLKGDALISGLGSHGLVRMRVEGSRSVEVQRIPLGARIRAVQQAPDGTIWVLEDQPTGRLLRLTPG